MEGIIGIKFSPNSKLMVIITSSNCQMWETSIWKKLGSFEYRAGRINDAVFSPDFTTLATASAAGAIRLWQIHTGDSTLLTSDSPSILELSFLPCGRKIVFYSSKAIQTWDIRAGSLLMNIEHNLELKFRSVFEPEATSTDRILSWYRNASGNLMLAVSPNGRFVACASLSGHVYVWDVNQETSVHSHKSQNGLHSMSFSQDGNLLTAASKIATKSSSFEVWDSTKDHLQYFNSIGYEIWAAVFSPDGRTVTSFTRDGHVWIWDWKSNIESVDVTRCGCLLDSSRVSFPSNRELVDSLTSYGDEKIWETILAVMARIRQCDRVFPEALAFSPDGKIIVATRGLSAGIELLGGSLQYTDLFRRGHQSPVNWVSFSPDGTVVTSAGSDATIRVWRQLQGRSPAV